MQPSGFSQGGRGRRRGVGPPTGNAQEAERRRVGRTAAGCPGGAPWSPLPRQRLPGNLWSLRSLALSVVTSRGKEEPGLNSGLKSWVKVVKGGPARSRIQHPGLPAPRLWSEASGTCFHWTSCWHLLKPSKPECAL